MVLCILFLSTNYTYAQEFKIKHIEQSLTSPRLTNLYIYAAGNREKFSNMWTANNTLYNSKNTYGKYVDVGVGIEMYKEKGLFQFCGSLGYKYETYSYDKSIFSDQGIDTHWLSADIKAEIPFFGAGMKSDIFLISKIRQKNNFSYNGINPECFNNISLCWYAALHIRFTNVKIEARLGTYIVPHLNPSKIAYYNSTTTHIDALYFEFKLSYRIFTTGTPHNVPHIF